MDSTAIKSTLSPSLVRPVYQTKTFAVIVKARAQPAQVKATAQSAQANKCAPAVVVLSPKVDTTFAKGVIRIATTIFGATLGMASHNTSKILGCRRLVWLFCRGLCFEGLWTNVRCPLAGYVLLLSSDVASNPYALSALLCMFAFIAGHLSQGPLKFGEPNIVQENAAKL